MQQRSIERRLDVGEVMTQEPQVARADEEIQRVAVRMGESGVACLPVLDEDDELVGMLGHDDLGRCEVAGGGWAEVTVREAMQTPPRCCWPGDSLEGALAIMSAHTVQQLAVVTPGGSLVGVVSLRDVVPHVARDERDELVQNLLDGLEAAATRPESAPTCLPDEA